MKLHNMLCYVQQQQIINSWHLFISFKNFNHYVFFFPGQYIPVSGQAAGEWVFLLKHYLDVNCQPKIKSLLWELPSPNEYERSLCECIV